MFAENAIVHDVIVAVLGIVNVNVADVWVKDFVDTLALPHALVSAMTVAGPGLIPTVTSKGALRAALVGFEVIVSVLATKLAETLTLAVTFASVRGFAVEASLQLTKLKSGLACAVTGVPDPP